MSQVVVDVRLVTWNCYGLVAGEVRGPCRQGDCPLCIILHLTAQKTIPRINSGLPNLSLKSARRAAPFSVFKATIRSRYGEICIFTLTLGLLKLIPLATKECQLVTDLHQASVTRAVLATL